MIFSFRLIVFIFQQLAGPINVDLERINNNVLIFRNRGMIQMKRSRHEGNTDNTDNIVSSSRVFAKILSPSNRDKNVYFFRVQKRERNTKEMYLSDAGKVTM